MYGYRFRLKGPLRLLLSDIAVFRAELPGSGKRHLLTALAQELIVARERKMHFTKGASLKQDLLAAKMDLRPSREIKRLGRYEGLIIR